MTWGKLFVWENRKFMLKKKVSNVIEKLMELGIHCLPCSFTNEVTDLSSSHLWCHIDVKVTSLGRHSAKGLSKTFDNSVVAMVTDQWHHWCRSMVDSIVITNLEGHGHAPPNFSMTLWTEIISTVFLKQIIFLKSFNSMLIRFMDKDSGGETLLISFLSPSQLGVNS